MLWVNAVVVLMRQAAKFIQSYAKLETECYFHSPRILLSEYSQSWYLRWSSSVCEVVPIKLYLTATCSCVHLMSSRVYSGTVGRVPWILPLPTDKEMSFDNELPRSWIPLFTQVQQYVVPPTGRKGQQGQFTPGPQSKGHRNSAGLVQMIFVLHSHSSLASLRGWFHCIFNWSQPALLLCVLCCWRK